MKNLLSKLPLTKGQNLKNVFSEKELDKLMSYFHGKHINNKESISSFSKKYGIARKTFRSNFKRLNFNIINYQNKLAVRPDLFNKIINEEDAYWLGFIYADGSVSDTGTITIDLKNSDKEHLYKFAEYCGLPKDRVKINQKASFNCFRCRLSFSGKGDEINNLEVYPRKSLTLTFPSIDIVAKHLIVPFIRGYFDGDGCYSISKGKKDNHKIVHTCSIVGTKSFLQTLKDNCPVETNSFLEKGNTWVLVYNTNNAIKFVNWIYKNSKIHLDRKYQKYNSPNTK